MGGIARPRAGLFVAWTFSARQRIFEKAAERCCKSVTENLYPVPGLGKSCIAV